VYTIIKIMVVHTAPKEMITISKPTAAAESMQAFKLVVSDLVQCI
jgi:hypothetical protein